ncbi:MAG: FAD:protein FMN transferase, partial [Halieaceae bacterium]|nr:FAD:protein FMN transferase [Halieaceae bacterium]
SSALASHAIAGLVAEFGRLESKYSRYLPGSQISQLNHFAGRGVSLPIDEETLGLCEYVTTLWRESNGLFDPTSGVLQRVWDFHGNQLPAAADIDQLLPLIGWDKLQYDTQGWSLPLVGMQVDFGGLAKEYAADCGRHLLLGLDVKHALINLAGDITTVGRQGNDKPWPVGIRHPRGGEQASAHAELAGGAIASSGDYERSIVINGRHYGHILNPLTGWPVEGLVGASVLADQCLVAGGAATTAILKPRTDGLAWLESLGVPWFAVDRKLCAYGPLAQP